MICTFGDITDVVWWRELGLPVRAVIQANGTFKPVTWGEGGWVDDRSRARAGQLRPARGPVGVEGPGRASSSCSARAATSSVIRVRSRMP